MDSEGNTETVEKMNPAPENKEVEVKPAEHTRKNSKGDKLRKKDDKSVEQVLKALNSLETTEEKLAAMCKKYADTVDENRKLQLAAKQCEKKCCFLQREKEQLQTEHSKAVLSRSRLESLCRELQRQNKAIKEESLQKVREEEEKRKEVSAKFQGTLNEITALMQQNMEKNAKLKEENVEMAQRFGKLVEQYEIREQQMEKLVEQIRIETELGEARIAKARLEMANEKEIMLREKQQLLLELEEARVEICDLRENDHKLRERISLYTDKYDEFKTALTRSSEVFNGFKGEMEKMSKKMCKLEKETTSWKQRWEGSHQALLEMAADKQQRDGELALANRRLAQMQALCRTLQAERAALLVQVRGGSEIAKTNELEVGDKKIIGESQDLETTKVTDELMVKNSADPVENKNSALSSTCNSDEAKEGSSEVISVSNSGTDSPSPVTNSLIGESVSQSESMNLNDNTKSDHPESTLVGVLGAQPTDITDKKPEEGLNKVLNDLNLSDIQLPNDLKKPVEVKEETCSGIPVQEVNAAKESLPVPSLENEEVAEEVGSTDVGINKESLIEELNSLRQKLDSCIISDESQSKTNSVGKNEDSTSSNQIEKRENELDNGSDLKIQPGEANTQPENECKLKVAEGPVMKENQSENVSFNCSNQPTEDLTCSPVACDTMAGIQLADFKKQLDDVLSRCEVIDTKDILDPKTTLCSEKVKSGTTPREKAAEKNSPNNAKKPDVPVNAKKGKESSRKRKR